MSDIWKSPCGMMELRLGRWQDVLADVECDAVITDPPYGARTHGGQRHGRFDSSGERDGGKTIAIRGLPYDGISEEEVAEICERWARPAGWFVALTSHDLFAAYERALRVAGRYVFAPLACVQPAQNVRLAGDGPSNWAVWAVVARRRDAKKSGALPGAYVTPPGYRNGQPVPGGKPVALMQKLILDYSGPGDLLCDPYAGGGTTLLAAAMEGRRAMGAEMDPETYAKAVARLSKGYTPRMQFDAAPKQEQGGLL